MLGIIKVKEGETVNVGSLLGTVESTTSIKESKIKEINIVTRLKKLKQVNLRFLKKKKI